MQGPAVVTQECVYFQSRHHTGAGGSRWVDRWLPVDNQHGGRAGADGQSDPVLTPARATDGSIFDAGCVTGGA
jgi:hypothetical protein